MATIRRIPSFKNERDNNTGAPRAIDEERHLITDARMYTGGVQPDLQPGETYDFVVRTSSDPRRTVHLLENAVQAEKDDGQVIIYHDATLNDPGNERFPFNLNININAIFPSATQIFDSPDVFDYGTAIARIPLASNYQQKATADQSAILSPGTDYIWSLRNDSSKTSRFRLVLRWVENAIDEMIIKTN